jgi:hypothetical protein
MTRRVKLHLAQPADAQKVPTYSQIKRAIKLYRGRGVPKAVYRRNALAWLRADAMVGKSHLLRGGSPKWGQPGEPFTAQVHAPRRIGG